MKDRTVRAPAVAGSWYPGSAQSLSRELDRYLDAVPPRSPEGRLVALVSPHAGLRYSGPVAAHGYALLRGLSELRVVLVGPSHHHAFEGVALFPAGVFVTPLGDVEIDEGLAASLLEKAPIVRALPRPHLDEHSLEMQLPFLKRLVPRLKIVPLLMGHQVRETALALAEALVTVLEAENVLLIASSDLSHYHPAPEAHRLDAQVVADVERLDPEALMRRLEASGEHACGGGPLVSVLRAAKALGATRGTILRYADSGDEGERDKSRVVGYLSAALTAS